MRPTAVGGVRRAGRGQRPGGRAAVPSRRHVRRLTAPAPACAASPPDTAAAGAAAAPNAAPSPSSPPPPRRPRVLLLHCGGTLGMSVPDSYVPVAGGPAGHEYELKPGTGGAYRAPLRPPALLSDLTTAVPELNALADLRCVVPFNLDSSRVGPPHWVALARTIHAARSEFDAFLVVHGTDTMAWTAAALSFQLAGLGKPVILVGSQLPLGLPRSDARQNLVDALTVATAALSPPYVPLAEVAICFGGLLLRGNRAQKVNATHYRAFASPTYPALARLGVEVEWNEAALLRPPPGGWAYTPRFGLEPRVARIPIVPGCDPRVAYGDCAARGLKGIVLETFGLGNAPDDEDAGWLPWLMDQRSKGLAVWISSQCTAGGDLRPDLYRSGALALALGAEAGPRMTPEAATVKLMLSLGCGEGGGVAMGVPLAGEM